MDRAPSGEGVSHWIFTAGVFQIEASCTKAMREDHTDLVNIQRAVRQLVWHNLTYVLKALLSLLYVANRGTRVSL